MDDPVLLSRLQFAITIMFHYIFPPMTIGLAYVAPIGMQNLFVINSALTQPRRRALLTALIVLICIPVSLGAVLLGGLFSFVITVFQDIPTALMLLGFGLGSGGVGILVAYPIWLACKGIVRFTIFTTKKMLHFVLKGDETQ